MMLPMKRSLQQGQYPTEFTDHSLQRLGAGGGCRGEIKSVMDVESIHDGQLFSLLVSLLIDFN